MPEGFKKLLWPKFNLVLGPSSNRVDDPGNKIELFSSEKHPKDLREMAKTLEPIYKIMVDVVQEKHKLGPENSKKLLTSLYNIRDSFTSKGKDIFPFEGNWKFDKASNKSASVSAGKFSRAVSNPNLRDGKFIEIEGKDEGRSRRFIRANSLERDNTKSRNRTSSLSRINHVIDLNDVSAGSTSDVGSMR